MQKPLRDPGGVLLMMKNTLFRRADLGRHERRIVQDDDGGVGDTEVDRLGLRFHPDVDRILESLVHPILDHEDLVSEKGRNLYLCPEGQDVGCDNAVTDVLPGRRNERVVRCFIGNARIGSDPHGEGREGFRLAQCQWFEVRADLGYGGDDPHAANE